MLHNTVMMLVLVTGTWSIWRMC